MATSDRDSIELRAPPLPPQQSLGYKSLPHRLICFRHPGYPDNANLNVLLTLYAFDHPDGGLHYGTAFLACAIVAVNAFNGYMTETRDGHKLEMEWDGLLLKKEYYFHVPSTGGDGEEGQVGIEGSASSTQKYQYPVYPSFEHWSFPHQTIPAHWPSAPPSPGVELAPPSASGLTAHVLGRDHHCLVTLSKDNMVGAHLCPHKECAWFKRNSMGIYNNKRSLGAHLLDDVSNAIALRSDVHTTFDQKGFLISRKKSKWIIHFLEMTNELGGLYHNTSIEIATNVSPQFLLVRFAWAIFPLLTVFLGCGVPRQVRVRVVDQDSFLEQDKFLGAKELDNTINPPKSRNPSPTKRPRGSNNDAPDAEDDHGYRIRKRGDAPSEDASEHRGRKRHRASSAEQTKVANVAIRSKPSRLQSPCDIDAGLTALEKKQLEWVRAQRPQDPNLLCCDYSEAERACRLGLPGKKELGGAYLCFECLGYEYEPELPPLADEWQDSDGGAQSLSDDFERACVVV